MRNWGVLITVFYCLAIVLFILPGVVLVSGGNVKNVAELYQIGLTWAAIGVVVTGQAILLFLSVDVSHRRLKPRAHVLTTCWTSAMLFGLLALAAIASITGGIFGDDGLDQIFGEGGRIFAWWGGLWLLWGFVFYRHFRDASDAVTRLLSWLLKGSVLELLIVVPCHIIVRRRGDCSAPIATGFGIATGLALMLLCFGPSVLLLYKKRLDSYKTIQKPAAAA